MTSAQKLIIIVYFFSAHALAGAPLSADSCQNDCMLDGSPGKIEVVCSCKKKHARKAASWAAQSLPLYTQAKNASREDWSSFRRNECSEAGRAPAFSAEDARTLAAVSTLPLCDCVQSRTHYPVNKKCETTRVGETFCRFTFLDIVAARPLRRPTAFDYQSCLAAKANYAPPESCRWETCTQRPKDCPAGQELSNLADPKACCPSFVCVKHS